MNSEARAAEYESRLDDGSRVLFRNIRPEDRELIRRGLEQLSPESRYRRFFRHVDHLSEKELSYLTEVDFMNHYALIATLPDEAGSPGIGVARWIRIEGEPTVAEGAVTVIDAYQSQGLGKTLLWLMAKSAVERGIRSFRAWVQGDNTMILGLLLEAGARKGEWQSGVMEVDIPLPENPELLEATPAPLVLKEVARGRLEGEARPEGGGGTRLRTPNRPEHWPPADGGPPEML